MPRRDAYVLLGVIGIGVSSPVFELMITAVARRRSPRPVGHPAATPPDHQRYLLA
jgi:hypothetical protein